MTDLVSPPSDALAALNDEGGNAGIARAMVAAGRDPPDTPFVAIFTMRVKPERRGEFLDAMARAMAESVKEPGIVSFTMLADRADPDRFTAVDVYRDRASYESHLAAPHSGRLVQELGGCMAEPPAGSFLHRLVGLRDMPATT